MQALIFLLLLLLGCGHKEEALQIRTELPTLVPIDLEVFTSDLLTNCKASVVGAKRAILVKQVVRIAKEHFVKREHQEAFLLLICIESAFQSQAKSKVGAVGLTQLLPKFASSFAEVCGLGVVKEADLFDSEVNLTLGACQFSHLLNRFDGNVALALSGYNSGEASETTKRLSHYQDGHPETMGYVAKFFALSQQMQEANK